MISVVIIDAVLRSNQAFLNLRNCHFYFNRELWDLGHLLYDVPVL